MFRQEKERRKQERMFEFVDKQLTLSSSLARSLRNFTNTHSPSDRAPPSLIPLGIGNPTTRRNPAYPGFDEPVKIALLR